MAFVCSTANGDIIANYEFTGSTSGAATQADAGVSAGAFSVTGGTLSIGVMDSSRTSPSGANSGYANLSGTDAFTLEVTPNPNQKLTITDIEVYTGKQTSGATTGAFSYRIGAGTPVVVAASYSIPRTSAGTSLTRVA